MDYAKWDALDSSDEEGSKPKQQAVHKQAVRTSAAEEREAMAEQARLAAAEAQRLQEQLETLEHIPSASDAADVTVAGDVVHANSTEAADTDASANDVHRTARQEAALEDAEASIREAGVAGASEAAAGAQESTAIFQGTSIVSATATPAQQASGRRRRLDHVRELDEERAFEATLSTKAEEAASRQCARAAIEAEEAEAAKAAEAAREARAAKEAEIAKAAKKAEAMLQETAKKPSLRRLKQLDPGTVSAIEQECGASLKSCDGFRLTLDNAGSRLKRQTRVLIVTAGNSFLCKASTDAKSLAAADGPTGAEGSTATEAADLEDSIAEGNTATEAADLEDSIAEGAGAESSAADLTRGAAETQLSAEGDTTTQADRAAGDTSGIEGEAAEGATSATEGGVTETTVGIASARGPGAPAPALAAAEPVACCLDSSMSGGHASVQVDLCFSRARPGRGTLAKKLGKVPVLHITVATDGLREGLEFIGVHQRQYFVEDPSTDAIAQNVNQSLLKVSLEFLFHPSRTRYVKETVVLRECSDDVEAREARESMMPIMAEQVRTANDKIRNVHLEFLPPQATSARELKSQRSFLILDEDMLKVAPQTESVTKRPQKSSFKGLRGGFLNASKAKKEGPQTGDENATASSGSSACCRQQSENMAASSTDVAVRAASSATTEDSCAAAAAVAAAADADSGSLDTDSRRDAEQTRINDAPSSSAPTPVHTERDDRRKLLLGSADVDVKVTSDITEFARMADRGPPASRTGETVAPIPEEEEPLDEDQTPASISELANQLFGDGTDPVALDGRVAPGVLTDIGDLTEDVQTESTKTPSPKASSRGGGAPSERSEAATEDSVDAFRTVGGLSTGHAASNGSATDTGAPSSVPAAGLRLLQQRRKDRGGSPKQEEQNKSLKDESDDLVNLWMKQRW